MRIPQFTLLAHNCWCQRCFMEAHAQLGYKAGVVCGHHEDLTGQWHCVYCGKVVYRHTRWCASLYQSVCDWLGWVRWEFLMWRLGY